MPPISGPTLGLLAMLGSLAALAACSPTFESAPPREVVVVPQGSQVVPIR